MAVEARGSGDRLDPTMRIVFGLGRNTPPENFSGGGGGGRLWWGCRNFGEGDEE
ncbi:hypothetical protein Tco_0547380, partial [Tanacetum coccineum]